MGDRELRCPSCDGLMQVVDRRGVNIDICRECRGVFLDRGELDSLLDLAARDQGVTESVRRSDQDRHETDDYRNSDDHRGRDDEFESWRRSRRHDKRRGGFLDDFFDFG